MNAKKVKAIRKVMKKELEKGTQFKAIFHPFLFVNNFNEQCVRYRTQYVLTGGKQMVKLAKKIYRLSGILPKETV